MFKQTRITLGGLKVAKFASEETLCFEARVIFDGKVIAVASNDGKGGMTHIRPAVNYGAEAWARIAEAETFAKTLPAEVTDLHDPRNSSKKFEIQADLEQVVNGLAYEEDNQRRLVQSFTRLIRSRVLYAIDGKVFQSRAIHPRERERFPVAIEHIKKLRPQATILNEMPAGAAFNIYRAAVEAAVS